MARGREKSKLQGKAVEEPKPQGKAAEQPKFSEVPNRLQLWKAWNLSTWGGKLPGREALRVGNSQKRNLARTIDDLPWPAAAHLTLDNNKYGRLWYQERATPLEPAENPQPRGSLGFA